MLVVFTDEFLSSSFLQSRGRETLETFFFFLRRKNLLKLINNHQAPGAGDFEQALHEAMGGR